MFCSVNVLKILNFGGDNFKFENALTTGWRGWCSRRRAPKGVGYKPEMGPSAYPSVAELSAVVDTTPWKARVSGATKVLVKKTLSTFHTSTSLDLSVACTLLCVCRNLALHS